MIAPMAESALPGQQPKVTHPPSRRAEYAAFRRMATRWADNDVFGHVNNAVYYWFFDTAIAGWLIERGLIGLQTGPMWVVAETGCRYLGELAFPDELDVGLRVARLGGSSVRYELAIFRNNAADASAEAHFVHVHMDRATRRPLPIPNAARTALAALLLPTTD